MVVIDTLGLERTNLHVDKFTVKRFAYTTVISAAATKMHVAFLSIKSLFERDAIDCDLL